ncbi:MULTISPECIES: exonuclease SbcCD subunit D [unclassified Synechococcus]|uniref:exonuclease SbcCD subunit D n=1 Tax=unclassified Synechococcus TaxID=2626047 RepID=UPI0000698960|nr:MULTISPECIES: exonuclease SbcCD subunit D [unclassified Synechococcus]EAQ74745.1 putative exonuclease [Synechococcus sp. WH 5701]WFN58143.1 exonuclease SbcCD subunit D [Synechococcus sp. CCFWC 502]
MRLLHTSDWHLGRSFHGASLLQEQAEVLARIVALARDGVVDAVLIAGDLYDRAIPPAEAVLLFNDTLAQLRQSGAAVVAIAGNHDSHVRVSVYDPLLASFGVTIRGDVRRAHEPVLVSPRLGGAPVAIYPLPYLEPAVDGPGLAWALEQEAAVVPPTRLRHDEVTRLALERIRRDLQQRPHHRSVLVAHTFVAGGESSESERELTVGNVDRVSVEAFTGFDYVALGHLHGSQQLDGPRLAYSGTPLPYSFSEQHHTKSVRIVELNAAGQPTVEIVPLQVGRSLATIEGCIEQLCRDPQFEAAVEARVRVILTDEVLPLQAMARLRERFPHVAELRHRPPELLRSTASERHQQVQQAASPFELTSAFFADQQGRSANSAEAELLRQALEAAARGGER